MSRISLQMYTMREHTKTRADLEQTVKRLAELGLRNLQYTVQPFMTVRETKELFDRYGIREDSDCVSFYDIENQLDRIREGAEVFKTPYLRTDSMPREMATPEGIKEFCQEANRLGRLIAPFGLKLLYHFHSYEFINFDGENGMDIFLRETDPEYVHLQPDTHWIHCGGMEVSRYLRKIGERVRYVHVKDYAIGPREELLESTPKLYAPVGTGNLDWPEIIRSCEEIRCEMYVIEQDNCYGADPFDCVKTSFDNLNKMGIS